VDSGSLPGVGAELVQDDVASVSSSSSFSRPRPSPADHHNEGLGLKNVYTSGWAATCAKGILTSMMMNMYATVDTVLRNTLPASELRH